MRLDEFLMFLYRTMSAWSSRIDTKSIQEPIMVGFSVREATVLHQELFKFSTAGITNEQGSNTDIIITGNTDSIKEILDDPERIEARVRDGSVRVLGNLDKIKQLTDLFKKAANEGKAS